VNEDEATVAITAALGQVQLVRIAFVQLLAERVDGSDAVGEGLQFPMTMGVAIGRGPASELVFRISVSVERPDVRTLAVADAIYSVPDSDIWDDATLQRVFGGRIAVPAVMPFARSKIRELTNEMGIIPVLLGMYEPSALQPA
jgi:hypothetical protein